MNSNLKRSISFLAIVLGFFMALLDTTIVNIALPEITKYYDSSMDTISWVVNGYNLAFAVFLITASRLADQFGRKKLFIIGVILFSLSSVFAGMSSTVNMLIFFRIVQGLSGAIVVPVTIPMVTEIFPKEKHGIIMGAWGAIAGLAAASGPALGGIITENFNWHWIFYVNVPIGIVTVLLAASLIGETFDVTASKKIDWLGMTTLTFSLTSITYALIKGSDLGWSSIEIVSLITIFIVFTLLFVFIEMKVKEPMLPMWLLKNLQFNGACLTLLIIGVGIMSSSFLLSFFLTEILGMTSLKAGLLLSIMPLSSMVVSSIIGPLSNKLGSKYFVIFGMVVTTLAVYLCSGLKADATRMDIVWRLILIGVGMGSSMTPVMGSVVRNVPSQKVGIASGITNMTRAIGTVLGVAILVTFLNSAISMQVNNAKEESTQMVISNNVLDKNLKDGIVENLKEAKASNNNENSNPDKVISLIDGKEQEALEVTPVQFRDKVKAAFEVQKDEIKVLMPEIKSIFISKMATAFSSTFKLGSALCALGIIFAFFSDKSKKELMEMKVEKVS